MHELLDRRLAPRAQRASAESAREPFHAGDPDAMHFAGVTIEHREPGVGEDVRHFLLAARFVVVIAENGHTRHAQRGQFAREDPRFFGLAGVGEIAGKQEHVGRFGDLREERLELADGRPGAVKVAERGHDEQACEVLSWTVRHRAPERSAACEHLSLQTRCLGDVIRRGDR